MTTAKIEYNLNVEKRCVSKGTNRYEYKDVKTYIIRFPFNLKNIFKEHFKTAKWEPDGKYWYISGTTANLNKLKAWEAAVEAKGIDTFSTPSVSRNSNYGPYRNGHPRDMDIPVWDEQSKSWYDAEY